MTRSQKNILVIGGSGFVGTVLVRELLAQGHSVRIADKKNSVQFVHLYQACDIRNLEQIISACKDIDVIYHLAAEHRDDVKPESLYETVNVSGTDNVCTAAKQLGIKKIIFTSSVAVYGSQNSEASELTTPCPDNPYGKTKLAAEQVLKQWQEKTPQATLAIIRPTVVFGEGNRGNVYNLMQQIKKGQYCLIGKGDNKKSMAYVENLVAFLVTTLDFDDSFSLYNYVDKPDLDMRSLIKKVYFTFNNKAKEPTCIPKPLGLLAGRAFDILALLSRKNQAISSVRIKKYMSQSMFSAEKLLATGFKPPHSLESALEKTIRSEFVTECNS